MNLIIGIITVIVCTLGGYAAMGGHLEVLWQPFEFVIIFGAGCGAYIIANPGTVLKATLPGLAKIPKGSKYNKAAFQELLLVQYQIFKLIRTKGLLSLEAHIEKPEESSIFQQFPKFLSDHHAVDFLCDYLRLISLGSDKPYELEALMDEEMETHHHEAVAVPSAIQTMSDGLPALGIVAAVLGVIKTMGAITEPPEVLGRLIGGALVGTFLGVWLSYGFVGPMASALKAIVDSEHKYFQCLKIGIIAHLHGYAPSISVEYARKSLPSNVRPSFTEVEEATAALAAP